MLDSGAAPSDQAPNSANASSSGNGARAGSRGRSVLATLVPNSAIQFLDFEMSEETVAHTRRRFLEEGGEGGEPSLHLAAVGDGVFYHPLTNTPCDPAQTYTISGIEALAPYLGTWLPLPYMRVSRTGEGETIALEEGPSNWVRAHISREVVANGIARYRVVVAIDTSIDAAGAIPGRADVAPTMQDLRTGAAFRFSEDVNDIAWFVSEAWVDDWIKAAFLAGRARDGRDQPQQADDSAGLAHLAHYLTALAALKEACDIPALRFLEPNAVGAYAETIPVDLALDLGTSRTCALLAEHATTASSAIGSSRPARAMIRALPLRDLSVPYRVVNAAFSSRLVFSRAMFGDEALSRWSGRTQAFHWPSPVRLGGEAQRLATEPSGADAFTGVSSPLHYVWDDRPSRHVWRFTGANPDGARLNPIVSGTFLAHLTETGELVEGRAGQGGATKPRFSRSALTTLLCSEILLHAISAINAPDARERNGKPNSSRRLNRVLVTPPAGMGEAEAAILRRRVEAAVKLVWQTMGWAFEAHPLAPPPPTVTLTADAATCTQFAWLDNEITHKFNGRFDNFLALMGKPRAGFAGARALRIATLDIGGATSGLSVATYESSSSGALSVTRQLVDGFETGCDDVVKALAERFLVPALAQRLGECKHGDPGKLLEALLGAPERGRPAWVGDLGRRMAAELLAPAADALMRLYTHSEADAPDAPTEPAIGTLIGSVGGDAQATADRLDVIAADEGADGFSPLEVAVPYLVRDLAGVARRVLRPMLDNVVRVLAALDCDVVLLSGRGAHLPVVREALLEGMPVRPDRVLSLHQQRLAAFEPSEDLLGGGATDTKVLPALGALVEGQGAFTLGDLDLLVRSVDRAGAAGFIGRLDATGRICADDVLFDLDGDSSARHHTNASASGRPPRPLSIGLPAQLGTRVPSIESWPSRACWVIEREPGVGGRPPKLPVRAMIELVEAERGRPTGLKLVSAVDGDGGRLDPGEIVLRLKTRSFGDGYWLDTGLLDVGSLGHAGNSV